MAAKMSAKKVVQLLQAAVAVSLDDRNQDKLFAQLSDVLGDLLLDLDDQSEAGPLDSTQKLFQRFGNDMLDYVDREVAALEDDNDNPQFHTVGV